MTFGRFGFVFIPGSFDFHPWLPPPAAPTANAWECWGARSDRRSDKRCEEHRCRRDPSLHMLHPEMSTRLGRPRET